MQCREVYLNEGYLNTIRSKSVISFRPSDPTYFELKAPYFLGWNKAFVFHFVTREVKVGL